MRQGLLGGVQRDTAATPEKPQDSKEICCDTCSATPVARRGVPAHVCNYDLAAKLPNVDLNFAVDSRRPEISFEIHQEILFAKAPLEFLHEPCLDLKSDRTPYFCRPPHSQHPERSVRAKRKAIKHCNANFTARPGL